MSGIIQPPAIFLMGATAAGKTGLAIRLVHKLPVEIISVDSAMVYRGMDIGTAKPEPHELAVAPHRLIDIVDPAQRYSAGAFRTDALAAMAEISASGRVPLLVGGTGLYFRVLQQGIAELPVADPQIRQQLDKEAQTAGWPALHRKLMSVDAKAAARIHPNDGQRIQRALEVFQITGRAVSDWHNDATEQALPYRVLKFGVAPGSRQDLRRVIEKRFNTMIDKGLLDEVAGLYGRGDLHAELPSMRAVGYRQLWQHLDGTYDIAEAQHRAIVATRQLAKRQMTWLRSESGMTWVGSDDLRGLENTLRSSL